MINRYLRRSLVIAIGLLLTVLMLCASGCALPHFSPLQTAAAVPLGIMREVRKNSPLPLQMPLAAAEGVGEKVILPLLP